MRKGVVWLIALLLLSVVVLLLAPLVSMVFGGGGFDARAETYGDDIIQSNDQNVVTSGDVVVGTGDSRALAFAHALGDVDINQCLASTQWGTILISKQKVVLNKWCAAEVYDAKGLYVMAAKVRCDIEEIAKHFTDAASCEAANTVTQRQDDQLTDIIDAQQTMYARIEEDHDDELRELEQRLAAVESKPAQVVRREPVSQYGITNEQREALAEVFKE